MLFSETQLNKIGDLAYKMNSPELWALYNGCRTGADNFDITLAVLKAIVEGQQAAFKQLLKWHERHIDPPLIVVDRSMTEVGTIFRVEPKKPQPAEVYFLDFIRSWWKRLTRPQEP